MSGNVSPNMEGEYTWNNLSLLVTHGFEFSLNFPVSGNKHEVWYVNVPS